MGQMNGWQPMYRKCLTWKINQLLELLHVGIMKRRDGSQADHKPSEILCCSKEMNSTVTWAGTTIHFKEYDRFQLRLHCVYNYNTNFKNIVSSRKRYSKNKRKRF